MSPLADLAWYERAGTHGHTRRALLPVDFHDHDLIAHVEFTNGFLTPAVRTGVLAGVL
jgi:hypothetical protein